MNIIYLILIILSGSCSSGVAAKELVIPFNTMESVSPDNNYLIFSEKIKKPGDQIIDDEWHKLSIKNKTTGKVQPIDNFIGYVFVKWSPDNRHFAIIYRVGSNLLYSKVYHTDGVGTGTNPVDIVNKKDLIKHYNEIISTYEEVIKWIDNKSFIFITAGIGKNDTVEEFEYFFEVSLDSSDRELTTEEAKQFKRK